MKKAIAAFSENAFVGACRHELSLIITNNEDGTTAPLGDIRRFAVESRGQGVDIALRAGIQITNLEY